MHSLMVMAEPVFVFAKSGFNMDIRKFKEGEDKWVSTHYVSCFSATGEKIERAFGEPSYSERWDGEKVQNEWQFMVDGHMVTIYDWKEYRIYDWDETLEWHIGSDCDDRDFIDSVKAEIEKRVNG